MDKMKTLLWLDDKRNPFLNEEGLVPHTTYGWDIIWVTNYGDFTKWITEFGYPDAISFDHDLAPEHYIPEYFWDSYVESKAFQKQAKKKYRFKTGEDCAKWLAKYHKANHRKMRPLIYIHSANPVGADWIKKRLPVYWGVSK